MGIQYNPRTVTDGLVLALDAGNPKSYPSTPNIPVALTGVGDTPANVFDLNVNSFSQGGINASLTWTGNIFLGTGKYYIIVQAWGTGSQGPISGVTLTVDGVSYTTDYNTLRNTNTDIVGQAIGQGGTVPGGSEQRRSNLTPLGSGALTSITLSAVGGGFRNYFYAVVFVPSGVSDTNFANHVVVTNSLAYPTTWTDLSGSGNTGTLTNGPTYSSANGGSIVFDGTNDYLTAGSTPSGTDLFTLSIWVYFNTNISGNFDAPNYYGCVLFSGNSLGTIELYILTNGFVAGPPYTIGLAAYGVANTGSCTISNINMPIQRYHNIVAVRDGSASQKIYLNGQLLTTGNVSNSLTAGTLHVAGAPAQANYSGHLNGRVSNVSIYNRALSASEVSQNFNALRSRFSI
jgi:hypothetical protein